MCRMRAYGPVLLAALFAVAHAHTLEHSRRSLPNGMQQGGIAPASSSYYSASGAQSTSGSLGGKYGPAEVTGSYSHSSAGSSSGMSNVSPDGSHNHSYSYSGSYGTSYNYRVGSPGSNSGLPPAGSFAAAGSGVPGLPNVQSLAAAGSGGFGGGCIGGCPPNNVYTGPAGNVGQYTPAVSSQYPNFPPQPPGNFHQQRPSPEFVPHNQQFSGSGGVNNYNGGGQAVSSYNSGNGAVAFGSGAGGFGAVGYVGNGGQQGTRTVGAVSFTGSAPRPNGNSAGNPGVAGVYVSVVSPGGVQGSTSQPNAVNGASSGGFASGNGGGGFSGQGVPYVGSSYPEPSAGTGFNTGSGVLVSSPASPTASVPIDQPQPVNPVGNGKYPWGGGPGSFNGVSNPSANPTPSYTNGFSSYPGILPGTSAPNSSGTSNGIDIPYEGNSGSPQPTGVGSASAETERPGATSESAWRPASPEVGNPGSTAGSESGSNSPEPEIGKPASTTSSEMGSFSPEIDNSISTPGLESEGEYSSPTPEQGPIVTSFEMGKPGLPSTPGLEPTFPDISESGGEEEVEPLDGNDQKRGSSNPDSTDKAGDSNINRFGSIEPDKSNTTSYISKQDSRYPEGEASYPSSNEGVNIDDRMYDIKKVLEYGSKWANPSSWGGPLGSKTVNLPFEPFNYFKVSSGTGPSRETSVHNYATGIPSPGSRYEGQPGNYDGGRQPAAPVEGIDFRFGEGIRTYSSGLGKLGNSRVDVLIFA